MPNKVAAEHNIQRQGEDDEAAVTGRTSSSTVETSIPTAAMETAGDAASSAENAAGREMTAKRRRPLSEEEDEGDDILPKKNPRTANNKNRVTFEGKEWEEETSSSTASTSDEEELIIPQKGHSTQHSGYLNSSSMPNYVTSCNPRFADHGHAYRDFSTYIEEGGTFDTSSSSSPTKRTFPANLHAMLSNDQYSHIISWMPHGRAFKVNDRKLFLLVEEATLGIADYPSFMRQLTEWGFKMMYSTGPDYGCYYHECFLRGHPQLTALMKKVEEPDFYAMAQQYPLENNKSTAGEKKEKKNMSTEDTERVLFLANVALEYDQKESSSSSGQCQHHDEMTAKTTAFKEDPSRKKKNKPWSKKKKKSHPTPNETVAPPPELDDLPPQSEDDPLIITTRLNALMERTHLTQTQLETYDKQNGLPRSHAQTMLRSSRSRSQFQEVLKNNQQLRKMGKGENNMGECESSCWEREDEKEV